MERELTLSWSDFIKISDLNIHNPNELGVYIWGFTIDSVFVPYYLGIADNIVFRIHEHINFIIGGRYTIFHKNSLAKFKDFKNQDVQGDRTKGKIYLPDWPAGFKVFIDNRKDLQPHIDFMVDTFTFAFASVDKEIVLWDDLKEIEKICFNQIGLDNLINTRAGYSDKFKIRHFGNPAITKIFKAPNPC